MGMFTGLRDGSWSLRSKSDPRWDADGRGKVGMFGMPEGARAKIDEKKRTLGEPPADLEVSYMKD